MQSIDHGNLGAEILEKDIRKYIETSEYDEIIIKAVKNHNKFKIEEGLNEKEEMFAQIVRDADKIDIFRVNVEDPAIDVYGSPKEEIINSKVTEEVLESFKRIETVPRIYKKTAVDNVVCHIAYVFGIYYKESVEIIINQGYFKKLIEFKSNIDITNKQFYEIREVVNLYIKSRLS